MSQTWLNILQQMSYTLGHFLWQGLIIALTLRVCLFFIDKNQAQLRYLCSVTALFACVMAPIYTFLQLITGDPSSATIQALPWVQNLVQSSQNMALNPGFSTTLQISHLLAMSWLLIVSTLLIKFFLELNWTQNVRRQQVLQPTRELQYQFKTLVQQLTLNKKVELLLSFKISSPMTLGFIKPVVLLPAQLVTGLNKEQLELVLLHELIHIKRYDYAVNLCQAIIELLLFFHPAVHWIGRQIRLERECICDQQVLSHRSNTIQYARLMTDLADYHQASSDLAIAASGGELTQRVQRMLNATTKSHQLHSLVPGTLIAILLAAFSVFSTNLLWQTVAGTRLNSEQNPANHVARSPIAQSSIAHWLLNPEQIQPQENILLTQGVIDGESAKQAHLPDNPVNLIVEQLTLSSQVQTQLQTAIQVPADIHATADLATEQYEMELAITDSPQTTASIAEFSQQDPAADSQATLASTDGFATESLATITPPQETPELTPMQSQMTVFANKAQKNIVKPVIKLQDDLSGQAQLLSGQLLIASTYPNMQEQAEILEAQVLKSYAPKYPKLAARRKLSKAVQVSFVIDVAGRVTQLDFEEDHQVRYFKGSISQAMKRWRFKPATINGKPVESSMTKIFDFNLEG